MFFSVGGDRASFQWDVAQGRVIRKFVGHDGKMDSYPLIIDYVVTQRCIELQRG
jgi:hypothetical protein